MRDLGGNQPNDNYEQIDLRQIAFVQVRDTECNIVGWKIREDSFGVLTESLRLYDSFDEAFESWQQSRNNHPDPP